MTKMQSMPMEDYEADDESGEEMDEDMDEFSFEEEGESDASEAPSLVPATPPEPVESKDVIEFQPESSSEEPVEESSSMMGSSEMEELEAMEDNPHGFVYSHQLDTYKRTKKENLELQNLEGKPKYEGKRRDRKNKNAGTTNEAKKRNKPFSMLVPKRVAEEDLARDDKRGRLKKKLPGMLKQTGHYTRNTAQRIEKKKKAASTPR